MLESSIKSHRNEVNVETRLMERGKPLERETQTFGRGTLQLEMNKRRGKCEHLQTDDYLEDEDLYDKTWLTVIYRVVPSHFWRVFLFVNLEGRLSIERNFYEGTSITSNLFKRC